MDGLKAEPLYSEQTLDQYACKPDHGRSDSTDAESEVWTLDGNRRTYRGIFVCCFYLAAVSGTWTLANADWGKYNRYHAVYTSNKMINVFATIFNAAGYYSGKNWRR